jgi:hypothetical protein
MDCTIPSNRRSGRRRKSPACRPSARSCAPPIRDLELTAARIIGPDEGIGVAPGLALAAVPATQVSHQPYRRRVATSLARHLLGRGVNSAGDLPSLDSSRRRFHTARFAVAHLERSPTPAVRPDEGIGVAPSLSLAAASPTHILAQSDRGGVATRLAGHLLDRDRPARDLLVSSSTRRHTTRFAVAHLERSPNPPFVQMKESVLPQFCPWRQRPPLISCRSRTEVA